MGQQACRALWKGHHLGLKRRVTAREQGPPRIPLLIKVRVKGQTLCHSEPLLPQKLLGPLHPALGTWASALRPGRCPGIIHFGRKPLGDKKEGLLHSPLAHLFLPRNREKDRGATPIEPASQSVHNPCSGERPSMPPERPEATQSPASLALPTTEGTHVPRGLRL